MGTISFISKLDTTSINSEVEMEDLVFIAVTFGFFLLAAAYVKACEKLR
jgi:hypothetical protein